MVFFLKDLAKIWKFLMKLHEKLDVLLGKIAIIDIVLRYIANLHVQFCYALDILHIEIGRAHV